VSREFEFVVVGGGSAGAVVAARLSEDPTCRVALVEAGDRPPEHELVPAACADLQLDPDTDWMYTADPGKAGLGLIDRRMPVPRGKMLGGSSGMNYMAYVRGHPGDFDAWSEGGASGWSYDEVLPYFRKSEGFVLSDEIVVDLPAHGIEGPLGVSVRSPVLAASRAFVAAAEAVGIPSGDYNGRDRGGPAGVASLFQTTIRDGKRSSTYRAFLEGETEERANLIIITRAQVTRVTLEGAGDGLSATGIEYRNDAGKTETITASREVILCAGAVGSPHILMLSGIGPRRELEAANVPCALDLPDVGKHLKDHLYVTLSYPAPGIGISRTEICLALGPDALREPEGPLPADPADDAKLTGELANLKSRAERGLEEWHRTGTGLAASSLYEATAFFSTGLGDPHSHDAQIGLFLALSSENELRELERTEAAEFFADPARMTAADFEGMSLLAYLALPHSEGEIVLVSADPDTSPEINMNYFADPHDLEIMRAVIRVSLELAENWPGPGKLGPLNVPPKLAEKHGYDPGGRLSDALLEDLALHYSLTVYHLSCTCRIGDVVDADLRVKGIGGLSVADASVMPNIVSGNTNAAAIMIGEKAAEMVARRHEVKLADFVGN